MAKYRIGQRVRIVRSRALPRLIGKEATIIGYGGEGSYTGTIFPYSVLVDGEPDEFVCLSEAIEPLTPPGQKEFKAEDILTMPNLPDFKTMTPEFARAWGGA